MRKVILVFLIMFLGLAPAYADTYVALVESQSLSLFNTILLRCRPYSGRPNRGDTCPRKCSS